MNNLTAEQTYWLSMICIMLGCLMLGFSFGYLKGIAKGWDRGFNSCSRIWNSWDESDEEPAGMPVTDATEVVH